tara:strand:+ start:1150 stop:1377 length:228 start_codon:yes stop_codon:yes gene_type:complete
MSDGAELPTERRMATWPTSDRCMFCKFWFDETLSHGKCRRFPQEVLTAYAHFCGEFKECNDNDSNNPNWKKKSSN